MGDNDDGHKKFATFFEFCVHISTGTVLFILVVIVAVFTEIFLNWIFLEVKDVFNYGNNEVIKISFLVKSFIFFVDIFLYVNFLISSSIDAWRKLWKK